MPAPARSLLRRATLAIRRVVGRLDPPTCRLLARLLLLELAFLLGVVGSLWLDNAFDCGRFALSIGAC